MFGQLQNKFSKIFKTIRGHGKISENNISDAIREIRVALLESDVNYKVVSAFIDRVKEKSKGLEVLDSITPGQHFIKMVLDEMADFLSSDNSQIKLNDNKMSTILLAGLQGSGKTTTTLKIGCFLKREYNKKPLLVGLDLQRPAASEQLRVLAENNDLDVFINIKSKQCLDVLKNAMDYAKKINADTLILDTAGRLHIDEKLINELNDIIKFSNPEEILYIADGMTGQDAVNSSKSFMESCNMTGCILTKMDGDSGGGSALSIKEVTGMPIKFITYGEKSHEIEKFNSESISRRILGLDDVIGLVEKAQKSFDTKKMKNIQEKIIKNEFNLIDFKDQIEQMENMGNINDILKYMPKMKNKLNLNFDKKKIVWIKALIDSMTDLERKNPEIINGSRRKRISKGAGRSMQELNQLLKQFYEMKKMMKKVNKIGKNKFPFNLG